MNINANISYFNELLAAHEVQLRQYEDELQSLPEGSLRVRPGRKENEKISWMTDEYDQSTFNLWEKSHVTAKGLHVRSKSEVIVAERLDYYRIPYRYEQVIYIDRYRFAPDFTILTKKGLMYWEHCGLMDDPDYARKQSWKNFMYVKAGIVPWRNYITTYDDEAGNFNSKIIESEIINKILPYC